MSHEVRLLKLLNAIATSPRLPKATSLRSDKQTAVGQYVGVRCQNAKLQQENQMNYRKLSMIALVGICVICLPVAVSASGDVNIQNFFSGPVLVTTGTQFTVCATNVAGGPNRPNGTVKILIGLLSADESRIPLLREAARKPPGQGANAAALSLSPSVMLPGEC